MILVYRSAVKGIPNIRFLMIETKKSDHEGRSSVMMQKDYFLFFQSADISSRVFPFVSGTSFHTKIAAMTQIAQ